MRVRLIREYQLIKGKVKLLVSFKIKGKDYTMSKVVPCKDVAVLNDKIVYNGWAYPNASIEKARIAKQKWDECKEDGFVVYVNSDCDW